MEFCNLDEPTLLTVNSSIHLSCMRVSFYKSPQGHMDRRSGCGSMSPGHSIPLISNPVNPHCCLRIGSVDFIHSTVEGDMLWMLPLKWF